MTLAMFPIVLWERNHSFVFWLLYNSLIAQRENEQDVRKKYSSTFFFLKTWPLKCVCNAVSSESRLLSCLNMRCLPLHHHLCSFRNHHRFPFHYVPHILKLQSVTFFVQNLQNLYYKQVHHESIFQTVFLACPESLRYTYNKCLYSDYLDWFGYVPLRSSPVPAWFVIDINREK